MRKIYFSFLTACLLLSAVNQSTAQCLQNFDGVVAPALPVGWNAVTNTAGAGSTAWATTNTLSVNAPNSVFSNDPNVISDEWLNSEPFPINSATAVLTFSNNFNLETGFDGMVLEISIGGNPFVDILAAGGTFATGGYNGTISTGFSSPIAGRQAWTGNSGGFILTTVNLPASANGQNIVLRFRRASDSSAAAVGANIDNVFIAGSACACSAPVISTNPLGVSTCVGSNANFTVSATGSALTYQWQVNTGSGFTNLADGAPYAGANLPTLTITGTSASLTGNQYRVVITGSCGTATSTAATLTLNQTLHSGVIATPSSMCAPGATVITGSASGTGSVGFIVAGSSGTINLNIPDNSAAGISSTIPLSGISFPTAADLKIRLNIRHSWVGDLKVTLTSPCGTTLVFDRLGVPATSFGNSDNLGTSNAATPPPAVYIFDINGPTTLPEATTTAGFIPAGTYKPSDGSNPGFAHNWSGLTFPCGAGNWTLTISDNSSGDLGQLVDWSILKTNTYTHTLTGPGTIVQNAPTGPSNANASFNVTAIPAGVQNYVLTSTDGAGCSAVSNVSVTVNAIPVITFNPAAPVACAGSVLQLNATATPPTTQTFSATGLNTIPVAGPAALYPSNILVSGLPTANVSVKSVTINGINHTFPADIDIVLQSPTGVNVVLMSDIGGATPLTGQTYTLDDAAAASLTTAFNPSGTYKPANSGATDSWPAPGPGSITQATPTIASFGSNNVNMNGNWNLYIVDDGAPDGGSISSWSITFNVLSPVVFSPVTNLFTDNQGTVAYAGTPAYTVYTRLTANTTYTGTATVAGCTGTANVTVTVNQLPAITTQPSPATQTICSGFNVSYTVAATGAGLTYQWRQNGVALTNGSFISGANTNTLTISNVAAANGGNYDVVVSGTCAPPVTSTVAALVIASAPTITTQPANVTVCQNANATFSVVTGGTPPATIFQWQSSPDGITWTNLTAGAFSSSFTLTGVTTALSGTRYRVIVTNSCGLTITSAAATLTVNATTAVVATDIFNQRICLSDTLIPLVGTPVGGSWSGNGVSGNNFIPGATGIGSFILTYTYAAASGCVSSDTTKVIVSDCPERIRLLRNDAVRLFPNPNNGHFYFQMRSTLYNYLVMKVYNTSGQLMVGKYIKDGVTKNETLSSPTYNGLTYGRAVPIDLSYLPAGTYLIKFIYDDGVRTSDKTFTVIISHN